MNDKLIVAGLVSACLLVAASYAGAAESIKAFVGDYRGKSISDEGEGLDRRDLAVSIAAKDKGFVVSWTTIRHKASGKTTKKSRKVEFIPTKRKNIYASAMKTNVFGGRQPLDPLKGDDYTWARIVDRTLTVYTLVIDKAGAYEMQVWDRTLTPEGLALRFARVREGEILKTIKGRLERYDADDPERKNK